MASVYEIRQSYFIEIPHEVFSDFYTVDPGASWNECMASWDKFSAQYPGVEFTPKTEAYVASGPRESLLTLKYDLEKKRYER